ncbi:MULTISPECIES: TetR/AcrR family transcriptional regulator [Thermodesulfovibrio]|uniref:TetR family transcriptional regulator n=1 Tax=Thermodesulfovibrio yellowstonii TaxID=28262 RepID=A0A9W6GFR1_9BACT|nr:MULTISPECIES: TetR/AcrR family transcriptional regulator [Thermodesulfovibrio]MBC7190337.1 TetR/AcrR family transcriptional regulator [Candidatus Aerophobetes bacterium]GLI53047.1 TetR family transcriptional regulator [Thermodesulfovibrio islandicus]
MEVVNISRRSGYESKKRIIDAAIKVFSQYGYNGATMRMIAKEAGISVGGVYLYFRNKEELSLFLIKEKMRELHDRISPILQDTANPGEALKEYIKKVIEFAGENRELILMHSKEHGFTFGVEIKREFFKTEKMLLKKLINEGINSGDFTECNSEEVAKLIMHILRGYVLSVVVDPENLIDPDECVKIIFNGLLKVKRDSSGH